MLSTWWHPMLTCFNPKEAVIREAPGSLSVAIPRTKEMLEEQMVHEGPIQKLHNLWQHF